MWNVAPRQLGWKLTSEQHTQIQRQRDAALARRRATRMTHRDSDTHSLAEPPAGGAPATEPESSAPTYGTNRRQQQMAEAMAAEARAAEAANAALEDEGGLHEWSAAEIEAAERDAAATDMMADAIED
jgi:hypothetical protein